MIINCQYNMDSESFFMWLLILIAGGRGLNDQESRNREH